MSTPFLFINASPLTLLAPTPVRRRHSSRRRPPPYRVSTTICMRAKRTRPSSDSSAAQISPLGSSEELKPGVALDESVEPGDDAGEEQLVIGLDDEEIVAWAQNAGRAYKGDDSPFKELLLDDDDDDNTNVERDGDDDDDVSAETPASTNDDDLLIDATFEDEDDGEVEEDDDEVDDDDDDDDDDEDEELAARASGDDFDNEISIRTLDKPRRSMKSRRITLDEDDEDDDVDDNDGVLEPIGSSLDPIYVDEDAELGAAEGDDASSPNLVEDGDEDIPENFDEETEEDIQSAANILSNSGLLGLGVEGGKRADVSAVKEFAMGAKVPVLDLGESFDDDSESLGTDGDIGEEAKDEDVIEDYPDLDEDEDDEFTLTSQSSYGRVWELNEDAYVTITEPGKSYAYELDEEDEEDQEMASVRRGKQGGWSGGLASYPADNLPKGSKEWIARRSYELMCEAKPIDMFQWTRRHLGPPPAISALYPNDPPPPTRLGKRSLKLSSPSSDIPTLGRDTSGSVSGGTMRRTRDEIELGQNALERSIKFPCTYKFKVEGGGDEFPESLRGTIEEVLGRELKDLELEVEPAGRYQRVVIPIEVESAQQVTILYDALRSNPSVKFSFG